MMKNFLFPVLLLFQLLSGCTTGVATNRQPPEYIPAVCEQLLWVQVSGPSDTAGQLITFEKKGKVWFCIDTFRVSVGRNGFAVAEEWKNILDLNRIKQEGDGCSPAGLFPLLFAFGYSPTFPTKMKYRTMQEDDICVDDFNSVDYNQHVSKLESMNNSHERMRRDDEQYKLGIWVGYNNDPIVPGNGSCIFLHIWKKEMAPTSGCTAMAEQDMAVLLEWLDKDAHPYLLQTTL